MQKPFKCLLLFTALYLNAFYLIAQSNVQKPKLVVGLVVDQMRWDFLYRYKSRFGNEGFNRLLSEGYTCQNTFINYIPTVTAAGHASIYTGSVPALNGIVGNDWYDKKQGKMVYCTEDKNVQTIGSTSTAGQMSPKNLWASTITDELKLASNFKSKVIGIALKDRGGILPAGHSANAAYWYDDLTGNWITSNYYVKDLPHWVDVFNKKQLPSKYLSKNWETLYPIQTYEKSTLDDNAFEGGFDGESKPTFPHKFLDHTSYGQIRHTPFGNSLTLDFAIEAIKNENLGLNNETDFLAISLSSTDYIGHQFGPNSIEIEDTYIRLDKDLASFLKYLDLTLGKGNYSVFLTADHGVAHNATFLNANKIPSGFFNGSELVKNLNSKLSEKYTSTQIISQIINYQIHLNNNEIKTNHFDKEIIKNEIIDYLKQEDNIAYAVNLSQISSSNIPNYLKERLLNGYSENRSGDIQIILSPAYYQGYGKTGTTHGNWNPYDSHIPLIFMGFGFNKGITYKQTHMEDISATIAALLKIQMPNACIGNPIVEVLKN